jgi:hypothetical protein
MIGAHLTLANPITFFVTEGSNQKLLVLIIFHFIEAIFKALLEL